MIDNLLEIVIIGAATWRLSFAITQEDVFRWLRELYGAKEVQVTVEEFGHERTITRIEQTAEFRLIRWIGALLSCIYCTSFWVGGTFWLVWRAYPDVIWVFAIAAFAAFFEIWRTK